ncbi:MAG: hypothetical protein JJU29_04780 [Verrucomicrobia bacterium]|nr:hypothetical protein [Verrucomicrobiota bacterium]MCH8510277.1 hypothetical protein [Kiritimatiellia bacterium]
MSTDSSSPPLPQAAPQTAWRLRLKAGIALLTLLAVLALEMSGLGAWLLYAATWAIVLHVLLGVYVFVMHLHALSRPQCALDGFAFLFLLGAVLSPRNPALWCAFFAGVFALAIVKYLLVAETESSELLRDYAREKIRLETPAVIGFALMAMAASRLSPESLTMRIMQVSILLCSILFAVYLIGIRRIYQQVTRAKDLP